MTWNFYDSSAQDATLLTLNIIRRTLLLDSGVLGFHVLHES
jgi:hypothetical protein